jgi:hypothetical protein
LAQQLPRHRKIESWTGEDLREKTILVWAEKDVAESVKLARFLPLLQERKAAKIIVECDGAIESWMAGLACVNQVVKRSDKAPKNVDYQISLGSLPGVLKCDRWPAELLDEPTI